MRGTRKDLIKAAVVLVLTWHGFGQVARGVIYVDADAPGSNDGSSWRKTYRSPENALNAASSSTEIRAAQAAYKGGDAGLGHFHMTGETDLPGGYIARGASNPDVRHVSPHEAVLNDDKKGHDCTIEELAVRDDTLLFRARSRGII